MDLLCAAAHCKSAQDGGSCKMPSLGTSRASACQDPLSDVALDSPSYNHIMSLSVHSCRVDLSVSSVSCLGR